ncbi:MAG TPA: diguanylate cyclase [Acidimicrobiales bacterium]|nr:diguanylate cyclase [Acidimicrobiales bacterium]
MENTQDQTIEAVRLARDLCMGMGAFVVSTRGDVRFELTAPGPAGVGERVTQLARSCLERPGAQGNEPFWNAEILGEDESADDSLACVAVPIRAGTEWSGLLGVVDTWLPELDEEQRLGLLHLTQALGSQLAQGAISLSGPGFYGVTDTVEGDPFPTQPPGVPVVDETADETTLAAVSSITDAPATRDEWTAFDSSLDAEVAAETGGGVLDEVIEHLPEGLVVARDDGSIVFANAAFGDLSGLLPEETLGQDITELLHRSGTTETEPTSSLLNTPYPGRRLDLAHVDGQPLPVQVSGTRFSSRFIGGDCHVAILREALAGSGIGSGTTLQVLLDALDEGIVVCGADGTVLIANREAKALQGLPLDEELVGLSFPYSPALCSSDGAPLAEAHHPMSRALHGTVVRSEQLQLSGEDRRHLVASAKPFELEDGSTGALLVLRDVTSQLEEEAWLMHLALHDPLTGLANRYLLLDYLRRVLLQFRTRGGSIALVFLDLDDFKMINDRFGHDVGDEVLVAVGRRIQGAVRSSDIVARLGGDEFVVAHAASDDPGEIEMVISRIRKTLTAPYQVRGQTLAVSASIGWVAADPRHEDPTTLLVRADREMYRRKSARHRAAEAAEQ